MSDYKLYYFPFKARGEAIRMLFAYKGIKYEDIRLPYGFPYGTPREKWLEFKPTTPFGMLPVLEETGGKRLGGSITILRYLAEKEEFNLAGSNAWENAQLASISGFISDLYKALCDIFFEKDEQRKQELQEKMNTETGPKYFGKLNELATEEGYLCYRRLTWPDLQFYCVFEGVVEASPEVLTTYPNLAKLKANIENEPNIAKWLVDRPQTDV